MNLRFLNEHGVTAVEVAHDFEISTGHLYKMLANAVPLRNVYRRALRDFLREKREAERSTPEAA